MSKLRKALAWWRKSLYRRLLVSRISILLFFMMLLGYLSLRIGQDTARQLVNQRNDKLSNLIAKNVDTQFTNIKDNLFLFIHELGVLPGDPNLHVHALYQFRLAESLTYRALYLFDSQGMPLIQLDDTLDELLKIGDVAEILQRPARPLTEDVLAAVRAAQDNTTYFSPVSIQGVDRIPVMWMSFPIESDSSQPGSILVVEVDLRNTWLKIDEVSIGATGRAFVVSHNGVIIAHPERSYIGKALPTELGSVLAGYEGHATYKDPVSGRNMLASYSPVSGASGWGIVVEQELAEVIAPVNTIVYVTLGVLLAALIIAITVDSLVTLGITRPIQQLAILTQRIAQTGDLNHAIQVSGQDEVGQLALTFNQMLHSLQRAETAAYQHTEQLEEIVHTRTRALEDAQEKLLRQERLAVLGQLAGGVGHELRNPLAVINNAVYFLRLIQPDADGKVKEYLGIIDKETRTAEKIITDLLDFARIKSVDQEPVDVPELARRILERYPAPASVAVTLDFPPDLPKVFADPRQLEQVLGNLAVNACQAMPEGGKLTISARQEDADGGAVGTDHRVGTEHRVGTDHRGAMVAIAVQDTGVGIPPEYMKKLFEPLFTTKAKGIGLGLAVSRKLVEANGGRIQVQSEPGKGSTFTIFLPLKSREPEN